MIKFIYILKLSWESMLVSMSFIYIYVYLNDYKLSLYAGFFVLLLYVLIFQKKYRVDKYYGFELKRNTYFGLESFYVDVIIIVFNVSMIYISYYIVAVYSDELLSVILAKKKYIDLYHIDIVMHLTSNDSASEWPKFINVCVFSSIISTLLVFVFVFIEILYNNNIKELSNREIDRNFLYATYYISGYMYVFLSSYKIIMHQYFGGYLYDNESYEMFALLMASFGFPIGFGGLLFWLYWTIRFLNMLSQRELGDS
ncbi:membrane protein of unknown function [Magnetospira sp. QH-2]|nr:membrane protein of unknown function [Magnetospira sp. QH-2]